MATIGHFWVKGYEYLRQLEYTFAILRDKREYLGDRYCNRREQKLAALADFPPLNYTCYPAISKEYLVETRKCLETRPDRLCPLWKNC